ncbi:MAG TPA: hypothetical protein PKV16_02605 [Caldisericia bacterium]|nr:hypothetical protein [Caldisericia bacterium]HPF48204.1 hypothetical protein [Caldisericia bacterium]HPI83860.1 hypothetical protein [Caldisericia bacterium]HPQ92657.1 hypothetical protein [Caldisericia bacterium]HRV74245.1 hypothetical protein [Caldisericia bacterium]
MRTFGLFALVLCLFVAGCSSVETTVVIEENAEPDAATIQKQNAENSSLTLADKQYLDKYGSEEPEEITYDDVKPIVVYPPEWHVTDLGNKVIFDLPDEGKITLEYQRNITGDGIDWVVEKLTELQKYGFVYRAMANIDPKSFKIIGDNDEAREMFSIHPDYPFNLDVISVGGYLGNKDCIWKLYGYYSDIKQTTNIYNTFKNARLVKWEEK